MDKIEIIRSKFSDKVHNIPSLQKKRSKMNYFERATEDEIKKLILSSSSKSSDLDPIPTHVLKYYLDILVTAITDIISISMDTSTFSKKIKEAHVRPLLKKTYLPNLTEKLQACILLECIFQNLRKCSSRLAASSYKKISVYLIHYNQLTGNFILQNQLY